MVHRERGKIFFECDDCEEVEETGTSNFDEAVEIMRGEGWSSRKIASGWENLCRGCSHD